MDALARLLAVVNRLAVGVGMLALLAAALVLTSSVVTRYLFHMATDWQDEIAVFCLTGATFLCGAWVQSQRGHVGIDAIAGYLSPRVNAWRRRVVDVLTFVFCAFFAWKSWALWHEAFRDGATTGSTFAPPLAIPYGLMAAGMTLLALQVLLQIVTRGGERPR
ncbi:MAG: TRAP transporter small permease [Proteobacteria bacterium]|nr:TRAP transporter small permease [Pseudomonadota bacterium]